MASEGLIRAQEIGASLKHFTLSGEEASILMQFGNQ